MSKTIRKSITMSLELSDWYKARAQELGISQSAIMTMALDTYIKQERAMDVLGNMQEMMNKLEDMKEEPEKE